MGGLRVSQNTRRSVATMALLEDRAPMAPLSIPPAGLLSASYPSGPHWPIPFS